MSASIMKISYESVGSMSWADEQKLYGRGFRNEEGHFYLEADQIDKLIEEGEIDEEALKALRDNLDDSDSGIEFIVS